MNLRRLLETPIQLPEIYGIGTRPFPRFGPALFWPGYRVLCSIHTADIPQMGEYVDIGCLEDLLPADAAQCKDTHSLLSHHMLREMGLAPPKGAHLLLYQDTARIHALASSNGWILLANPYQVRVRWENKAWFRKGLSELGLDPLVWEVVQLDDLKPSLYRHLRAKWGDELVFQIPDFPRGGGRATFFVNHDEDFKALLESVSGGVHRNHRFKELMVSPRVVGPSLSMLGCVTPKGVVCSPIQTQLVDVEEVLPGGHGGRFCGHQWGDGQYPPEVERQATRTVICLGKHLQEKEGYKGVFGVDFMLDNRKGRLHALECNPRYTGAFPVLSMVQLAVDTLPIEALHILSFLDIPVALTPEEIHESRGEIPPVSQIILFHRQQRPGRLTGTVEAGLYRWPQGDPCPQHLGPSYPLPRPPWNSEEFMIVDGPPSVGSLFSQGDQLERITRVILFQSVLEQGGSLSAYARSVVKWLYDRLAIEAVDFPQTGKMAQSLEPG